jgi:hypothetical protein
MYLSAAVLLLLASPPDPDVITLSRSEVRESSSRAFGFYGRAVCGTDGTLYLRAHVNSSPETDPVWSFSARGEKIAEFEQVQVDKGEVIETYAVSGDGTPYVLVRNRDGDSIVIGYSSDGKPRQRTKLQLPERLTGYMFGLFGNGNIFVDGSFYDRNLSKTKGKQRFERFTAIFKADGSLVKRLGLEGEPTKVDPATEVMRHTLSFQDGNLYLLGTRIVALSPNGDVVSTIRLHDEDGYSPRHIFAVPEGLAVEFSRPGKDGFVEILMHVYDPLSGELLRRYRFAKDVGNSFLCPADGGFLFFGVKQGRVVFSLAK